MPGHLDISERLAGTCQLYYELLVFARFNLCPKLFQVGQLLFDSRLLGISSLYFSAYEIRRWVGLGCFLALLKLLHILWQWESSTEIIGMVGVVLVHFHLLLYNKHRYQSV